MQNRLGSQQRGFRKSSPPQLSSTDVPCVEIRSPGFLWPGGHSATNFWPQKFLATLLHQAWSTWRQKPAPLPPRKPWPRSQKGIFGQRSLRSLLVKLSVNSEPLATLTTVTTSHFSATFASASAPQHSKSPRKGLGTEASIISVAERRYFRSLLPEITRLQRLQRDSKSIITAAYASASLF